MKLVETSEVVAAATKQETTVIWPRPSWHHDLPWNDTPKQNNTQQLVGESWLPSSTLLLTKCFCGNVSPVPARLTLLMLINVSITKSHQEHPGGRLRKTWHWLWMLLTFTWECTRPTEQTDRSPARLHQPRSPDNSRHTMAGKARKKNQIQIEDTAKQMLAFGQEKRSCDWMEVRGGQGRLVNKWWTDGWLVLRMNDCNGGDDSDKLHNIYIYILFPSKCLIYFIPFFQNFFHIQCRTAEWRVHHTNTINKKTDGHKNNKNKATQEGDSAEHFDWESPDTRRLLWWNKQQHWWGSSTERESHQASSRRRSRLIYCSEEDQRKPPETVSHWVPLPGTLVTDCASLIVFHEGCTALQKSELNSVSQRNYWLILWDRNWHKWNEEVLKGDKLYQCFH